MALIDQLASSPIALQGGMNLVTPALRIPAGHVIGGMNYEPDVRGYARVRGHERFSGKPKPSQASYWVLNFDAGVAAITAGQTVTGATSSATGIALYDATVTAGSYGSSNAAGYLVLTNVSGTFQDNENLQVGGVTKVVANGVTAERGALADSDDTTWIRAAIEYRRAQIAAVPGEGPVRGVWVFNGSTYAIRNNVGSTAGILHKATASGWTAQDLGRQVSFTSGGVYEILAGDTITGATSGATATVRRVIKTSGTWAGGDAAGRLILSGQTGTFQSENLNVGANSNVATIAGNSTANALPAGGRYDFENHNFFGATNRKAMYGVNGVGPAFEYDGTVMVSLPTGMLLDTPQHLGIYKNHLFLSFPGGSIQFSGTGDPYTYQVILGAGEIGLGEDVTDLMGGYKTSMPIFGRNKVAVLYGNDASDFALSVIAEDAGGVEWTVQNIGTPMYLDDSGVRTLDTTDSFGDWRVGTVTQLIEPLIRQKREAGITAVGSIRVRSKDQYRLFYSDGTGLTVYMGRKKPETLPFDLGVVMSCACSSEDFNGNEIMFFGDADGFVYQIDAGTSFDGDPIQAYLRLPYNHLGSPSHNKVFKKVALEVDVVASSQIGVLAEFSYADSNQPPSVEVTSDIRGGGGFWDVSNWNQFIWSGPAEGQAEAYIDGFGKNISLTIISESTYEEPHTLHGLIINFVPRGLIR